VAARIRKSGNSRDSELSAAFAYRFRKQQWLGDRALPEIYFDPRSLAIDAKQRAVLHAKCVVVDGRPRASVYQNRSQEAASECQQVQGHKAWVISGQMSRRKQSVFN
jgi:hypothetical protein